MGLDKQREILGSLLRVSVQWTSQGPEVIKSSSVWIFNLSTYLLQALHHRGPPPLESGLEPHNSCPSAELPRVSGFTLCHPLFHGSLFYWLTPQHNPPLTCSGKPPSQHSDKFCILTWEWGVFQQPEEVLGYCGCPLTPIERIVELLKWRVTWSRNDN